MSCSTFAFTLHVRLVGICGVDFGFDITVYVILASDLPCVCVCRVFDSTVCLCFFLCLFFISASMRCYIPSLTLLIMWSSVLQMSMAQYLLCRLAA